MAGFLDSAGEMLAVYLDTKVETDAEYRDYADHYF
jgi:hypothetical protein